MMPFSPRRSGAPLLALSFLLLAPAIEAQAGELALKRVALSTGGVGYFEYEAEVEGAAELSLSLRRDQMDDVLKSIVVFDDRGNVGAVEVQGEEPLRDAFRELPFGEAALRGPADLLQALRGAEIRILGPRQLAGRVLSVTPEPAPQAEAPLRHRLAVMTARGLQTVVLEEVEALEFADAALQRQVDDALAAVLADSVRDRRRITIHSGGEGRRMVRVAYVAEVPLWKASYRLTLEDAPGHGALQGWAVVENRGGEDWRGIELTLLSGSPVTFRQALYATYYLDRPEVPVEVVGRVLPPPDRGGVPMRSVAGFSERAPAPAMPAARLHKDGPATGMAPPPPAAADLVAAEAREAETQVRFRLPAPVSLASGHNLLVPLVDSRLPATRVALYQPAVHDAHPLAAVSLENPDGASLPPGVLTLYQRDGSGRVEYLGDARLGGLPNGESRLLSFALDTRIRIETQRSSDTRVASGRIADGLLHLELAERRRIEYRVGAPPGQAGAIVIDQPRPGPDWLLETPESGAAELVGNAWRLRLDLPESGTGAISVVMRKPLSQTVELAGLDPERIAYHAASDALGEAQRAALVRLGELARALADREREVTALEQQRAEAESEQARLRANLDAVPDEGDLQRRYLRQLGEQEDRLGRLGEALANLRDAREQARQRLAGFIRDLDL